jgi:hypothetical protein
MSETLMAFQDPVVAPDGTHLEARACGASMPDGRWQGWIEFVRPEGLPVRTPRETIQPNREDATYWATGLSPIYLQGALRRALEEPPVVKRPQTPAAAIFSEPAPGVVPTAAPHAHAHEAVLNPFSVYEKGEAILRGQLLSLNAWHLVNIILHFGLSDLDVQTLNGLTTRELAELTVAAVRYRMEGSPHRARGVQRRP